MASEEAETYLRLMAETELRHALALPKVRQRRHRRFPSKRLVRFAFHRLWLHRLRSAAMFSAPTYAHRVTAARGRHADAYEGLNRLDQAADALVAVDAIDEDAARKLIADQGIALEVRQRILQGRLHHLRRPASGPPPGPYRAVGIAKRAELEVDGNPAEITLLALVIGPDRAVLPMTAKRQVEADDDEFWFFNSAKAVDNLGGSYRFGFNGGGSHEEWIGELELHPVPGAAVRWLDLTLVPGAAPIRINLDQATSPEPEIEPLPRSELAERYVDKVAEQLLTTRPWDGPIVTDGVMALIGAGLITFDNPALARLATLARRRGVSLPSNLADLPDTDLPERWLNVLDATGAMDGPAGIAAAAAVLPELDGSRWEIAGLRSKADSAELHVFGWGPGDHRSYHPRLGTTPGRFSWWARDSTGRWHVASRARGSWDDDHSDLTLRLTPALHPAATSIDVMLTGKSGRVTVTLPLDWQEGA